MSLAPRDPKTGKAVPKKARKPRKSPTSEERDKVIAEQLKYQESDEYKKQQADEEKKRLARLGGKTQPEEK